MPAVTACPNASNNIIAYNGTYGIIGASGGFVLHNSIHSNGADGLVMYSDPPDYGVPPSVQSASRNRGQLTISGGVHAAAQTDLEIEIFANEACDPTGIGEGQLPVGTASILTDGSGDASFSLTISVPAGRFQYVTATVTTVVGGSPRDTSSFSNCLPVSTK